MRGKHTEGAGTNVRSGCFKQAREAHRRRWPWSRDQEAEESSCVGPLQKNTPLRGQVARRPWGGRSIRDGGGTQDDELGLERIRGGRSVGKKDQEVTVLYSALSETVNALEGSK